MATRQLMKRHFCETLLAMCEERALDTITVTALVARAGTAKQTFYNNFKDINDLINFIPRAYMLLTGAQTHTYEAISRAYMFAAMHPGFFCALPKLRGQNNFRDEFISFGKHVHYRDFLDGSLSERELARRKLSIDLYVIGVTDHFLEWCAIGMKWPPDLLARVHSDFVPDFMRDGAAR